MVSRRPTDEPAGVPSVAGPARRPWPDQAHLLVGALVVIASQALMVALDAAQPGLRASLPGFLAALIGALMAATPLLLAVVCVAHGITLICTHAGGGRSPSAEVSRHQPTLPRWR